MKGMSFQNGVEFKLSLAGESWQQTGKICGELTWNVRNPGAPEPSPRVILVETTERKLKAKSEEAFQVVETREGADSRHFEFLLAPNARISDKAGSLYLLYGTGTDLWTLGRLRLQIDPHPVIQDWIDLLRTHFRFSFKRVSQGKRGFVEAELDAPSGSEWAQLESLVAQMQWAPPQIETQWIFHRKEVDGMKAGLQTKVVKREVERSLPISEIVHAFNGRLNKDLAEQTLQAVFDEYRGKGWLS